MDLCEYFFANQFESFIASWILWSFIFCNIKKWWKLPYWYVLDLLEPTEFQYKQVGIGCNLRHDRSDELKQQFSRDIISAFSTTSFAFAILVTAFSVPKVLIKIWQDKFTIHVLQLEWAIFLSILVHNL